MPTVHFTSILKRHIACPEVQVEGETVAEALAAVFAENPQLEGYVVDDQGALRKHVNIFLDGSRILDRKKLTDPVLPTAQIHVLQALSGG